MQPKLARVQIALIDECEHGKEIGRALAEAGFDVTYASAEDGVQDGAPVFVRVGTSRSRRTADDATGAPASTERGSAAADPGRLGERQKMEAIARLAGGVAHDFNNILSVISVCTDEVLDAIEPNGDVRACFEDIRHAIERGASVTRDLLAFSQRDIRSPQLVALDHLVTSSCGMIERLVGSDVRVETELTASEALVRIDPAQWSSVFVNLARNARCAMSGGGTFALRTRVLTVDPRERLQACPPGSYVEVEVTDTGCGMTEEVRARAFEPFFTTKDATEAAGLGLSVVFGIVEQSGGWIDVTSEVGRGTTFRLYVPVAAPPPTERRPARSATEPGRSTVLVVEDEDAVRRIAVRALERSGHRVLQAATAEEALARAAEDGPIDLLVADVVLPGMNGRRLAETLAKTIPKLAVLYTSGYSADEALRRGVASSELCFLPKPYSAKALVERVAELLAATGADDVTP